MNLCQTQCIPHMPDAYAGRMHSAYAEENRTEQSTNEDSLVTYVGNLAFGDARDGATKNG